MLNEWLSFLLRNLGRNKTQGPAALQFFCRQGLKNDWSENFSKLRQNSCPFHKAHFPNSRGFRIFQILRVPTQGTKPKHRFSKRWARTSRINKQKKSKFSKNCAENTEKFLLLMQLNTRCVNFNFLKCAATSFSAKLVCTDSTLKTRNTFYVDKKSSISEKKLEFIGNWAQETNFARLSARG